MQRLFRKVGKLSSKPRNDIVNSTCGGKVEDILESKTCIALANGSRKSEPQAAIPEEILSPVRQKRPQNKKKRNSLIESFRKLKRHSKTKDTRRSVDSISGVTMSSVNEEIKINRAATACDSEIAAEDQTPSTREMSVNGDVPSLSLSILTLRSLGSADASAVHSLLKTDAASDVVERASGDVARADFLAREVPGTAGVVLNHSEQPSSESKTSEDEVMQRFGATSILLHSTISLLKSEESGVVPCMMLAAERPCSGSEQQESHAVSCDESAVTSTNHPSTHRVTESHDGIDDLCQEGNRIHDVLPVDLLYWPIPVARTYPNDGKVSPISGKANVSNEASPSGVASNEDSFSAGLGSGKWSLMRELTRLSRYGWYWGPISRAEAEDKLADQPEGAFLIRDSTDERYLFSLSFRSFNRTLHTRIEYCNGEFSFYHLPQSEGYRSLVDLIENAIHDSLNGIFYYSRSNMAGSHSYAVKLTKPVSRFTQVRSLQYLCRFIIRQHTRVDHIQNLPLPVSVKGWLRENQY